MANTLKFGAGQWATKEGSTLAYNDENDNYKPLPFTFTRASNATVVNKSGLIETVGNGIPRIDYKDDTNGALLLEPQRTNLITYSEDFSQDWSLSSATITSNSITSPEGLVNATTLDINVFGGGLQDSFSVPNGDVTFSLFVKKGTTNGVRLRIDASTDSNGFFDLVNNTVYSSTDNASIQSYGNGWYKISLSANITSFSKVAIYGTNGLDSYQNGSVNIWGGQLEVGAYPTSYIPTQGSAVTRLADSCNNGGNEQVINSTEGVLYLEVAALSDDLTNRAISISSGTAANKIQLKFDNSSNQIEYDVARGGVSQVGIDRVITDTTLYNKIACKWKVNDFSLWVNGVEIGTDTSGDTPLGLSNLSFYDGNGGNSFYSNVRDVKVYNTALSDNELAALTQV